VTGMLPLLAAVVSAAVAGALTVALLVLLPLLMAQPDDRYPETNTFVLRRMDTVMPLLTLLGIGLSAGAVPAAPVVSAAVLHALAVLGLLVLLTVSAIVLRRVNASIAAAPGPAELRVLRHRWRGWHLTRVGGALAAAVANTAAVLLS